jgi:hypothetical protein
MVNRINARISILLISMLFAMTAMAGVKDGYTTPLVTVPYAWNMPVIDGKISDAEWQGAASINALQTTQHMVSPRQTRFWMLWNEDNLFVAMRSPLRAGERIIQALRDPSKDINVVFDDSYEVVINVNTKSPDGQTVFFQYLSNYANARYDVMHEPAVGNSRIGWTAGWTVKNSLTADGTAWEMEMMIPRTSLYKKEPFVDGFKYACLVARNFKRPWEQNTFEGTSSFSVSDSFSKFVLSKSIPAIHLLSASDGATKQFGIALAAQGQRDDKLKWSFSSDGGVVKEGTLDVKKGALSTIPAEMNLDKPGKGDYRIKVTSADGTATYLDWCAQRQFGDLAALAPQDDKGDQVGLSLEYNPVNYYLRVTGDFINYDTRNNIAVYRVEISNEAGKVLAAKDFKLDSLAYIQGIIKIGEIPAGTYTARMTCLDAAGKTVLTREKAFTQKDHTKFAWWKTKMGNYERVLAPWTPVAYQKKTQTASVWGRDMKIGAAGLPAQISSQKKALLPIAATLTATLANGKVVTAKDAKVTVVSQTDNRIVLKVVSKLDKLPVTSVVTVEYDGMYKVDMTMGGKNPVQVKDLKILIPIQPDADFLHATGEGIRYGFFTGFLPKDGTGRIWDSTKIDGQSMTVGSFIPYVWLGSADSGFCWFADSDQGWTPNNNVPAIEIRRDKPGQTMMVMNLISAPETISAPRTVTFALQATPVKPMHEKWRMDSWWCGDTFKDWQFLGAHGGSLIWTNIPFTLEPEKCKKLAEQTHAGTQGFIQGINKYRANAVPYLEWKTMSAQFAPEVGYFGDQWKTQVGDTGLAFEETLSDYMVYQLGNWANTCQIDGVYLDNVRPQADNSIECGRGYILPDGRVQPTFNIFELRKLFLRFRAVFQETRGQQNKFVLHMTNNTVAPWVGAADVAYDGEHHVIYPELNKDFMDYWSLERLRIDYSGTWGTAVNFMHEYQGAWDNAKLIRAMRAYTGAILLHDALPSGNSNGLNTPAWIARDRFGIETADVQFLPYWNSKTGITYKTKDVYVAGWKKPGKILLAVVNYGEKADAEITLDVKTLGLPEAAKWKVSDAEKGTSVSHGGKPMWSSTMEGEITVTPEGILRVPVQRHDYRQIIIEAMQ